MVEAAGVEPKGRFSLTVKNFNNIIKLQLVIPTFYLV